MEHVRWTRVLAPTLAAALALAPALGAQTYPPGGDPRDNLKAGLHDAGEAAKGMKLVGHTGKPAAFDRLFLEYMIRHHEGALKMVADLVATPRAAQDVDVSVLANDVESTQTAEIGLMRQMLLEL